MARAFSLFRSFRITLYQKNSSAFRQLFLLPSILIAGIVLRSIYIESSGFGFDQVQIAENAQAITQGKFTLIGPRTGPADMFTGPLIYYISAVFTLFLNPATATVATATVLSILTGLTIFFLSTRYLPQGDRWFVLALWAFSPLLIRLDRIPWNPNLMVLSSSLVFFPLLAQAKWTWKETLFVSIGVFLGYQAHFSGFLLLPLAVLCLLLSRRFIPALFAVGAFLLSLVPTLLFDLRHDWLNARGFIAIFHKSDSVGTHSLLHNFFSKTYALLDLIGRFFLESTNVNVFIVTGVLFWGSALIFFLKNISRQKKSRENDVFFAGIWVLCVILTFSVYNLTTPEYYYLLLIPPILIFSTRLFGTQLRIVIALFLLLFSSLRVQVAYSVEKNLDLGVVRKMSQEIAEVSQQRPIREVVIDTENLYAEGLNFWLQQRDIRFSEEGPSIHVVFPYNSKQTLPGMKKYSSTAITWIDIRTTPGYEYWPLPNFYLGLPEPWQVATKGTPQQQSEDRNELVISSEELPLRIVNAIVSVEPLEMEKQDALPTVPLKDHAKYVWHAALLHEKSGYTISVKDRYIFVESTDPEFIELLELLH